MPSVLVGLKETVYDYIMQIELALDNVRERGFVLTKTYLPVRQQKKNFLKRRVLIGC